MSKEVSNDDGEQNLNVDKVGEQILDQNEPLQS